MYVWWRKERRLQDKKAPLINSKEHSGSSAADNCSNDKEPNYPSSTETFSLSPTLDIFSGHFKQFFFIVAPCILNSTSFTHQKMHYLLTWLKVLIYIKIHNNIAPTCFGL
jgi:hypothetical protein